MNSATSILLTGLFLIEGVLGCFYYHLLLLLVVVVRGVVVVEATVVILPCLIEIPVFKVNSVDPDQTPCPVTSDLVYAVC